MSYFKRLLLLLLFLLSSCSGGSDGEPTVTPPSPPDDDPTVLILDFDLPPINSSNNNNYTFEGTCSSDADLTINLGGVEVLTSCTQNGDFSIAEDLTALSEGTYSVDMILEKGSDSVTKSQSIIKDLVAGPLDVRVDPGAYGLNDPVTISVLFSSLVTVDTSGGIPSLSIQTGGVSKTYILESGAGTDTLYFTALVSAGEQDLDGLSLASSMINLNGASMNVAGMSSGLDLGTLSNNLFEATIYGVQPSVNIESPSNINSANVSDYSVSGTCSPNGGQVTVVTGSQQTIVNCQSLSWTTGSLNLSSEPDSSSFNISAIYEDPAGNLSSLEEANVVKDTTSTPNVTLETPDEISNSNMSSYELSGTCSENGQVVEVVLGSLSFSPNCSSGVWSTGEQDVSSLADSSSIALTVDHQNSGGVSAPQVSASVNKDSTLPSLNSNTIPAQTYNNGQDIQISLVFNEAVTVSGTPRIQLSFESQSSATIYADYLSGSTSQTLLFQYTVTSGDNDSDGIELGSIELNGGSIKDSVGNDLADNSLPTTSFLSVRVDSAAPFISSFIEPANGTYATGGELLFQVNFSENVNVTGTPRISINLGGSNVYANYQSGSGSAGLEFSYIIQSGDSDSNGITLNSASIDINGGAINATSDSDPSALGFINYLDSMDSVIVDTSGLITPPDEVTGLTTAPTAVNTELSVTWNVPNDNGTFIIEYVVQYREQGVSTWSTLTPSPASNSAKIGGLSEGVTYELRVAANNGVLGPYSNVSTATIFDVLSLDPIAWLSSTNITNGGSEPVENDLIGSWEDITGAATAATESNPANQPVYKTNVQNGLPAVRFQNKAVGLEGTFNRSNGTNLTFVTVGQFDSGSSDRALFEFYGGGGARGFFIDRRYSSNTFFDPAITKSEFKLWTIEDAGGSAKVSENQSTVLYDGATLFNTSFTGSGGYVLGDDRTGGNRLNGFIGEFLVFDKALTPTEIDTLETYLINKWGL